MAVVRTLIACTVLVSLSLPSPAPCIAAVHESDSDGVDSAAIEYWNNIKAASADAEWNPAEEPGEYWYSVGVKCRRSFVQMVADEAAVSDRAVRLRRLAYFVEQFGKHGANADLQWVLADDRCTLTLDPYGRSNPAYEDYDQLQTEFNALLVERFSRDKAALLRYYHLALWTRSTLLLGSGDVVSLSHVWQCANFHDLTHDVSDGEFWLAARNFCLAAMATGRYDLIEGMPNDKKQILERWQQWAEWIHESGVWLRPSDDFTWSLNQDAEASGERIKAAKNVLTRPTKPFVDWPHDFILPKTVLRLVGDVYLAECARALHSKQPIQLMP